MVRSYAQNYEDVLLWRALGHVANGRYLDIGAQHPICDNVSLGFYLKGWRGIHIEPSAVYAAQMRDARPDETVIQAAVTDEAGPLVLHEIADSGLSTGIEDIAREHASKGIKSRAVVVATITLADIFALGQDDALHWLKIDVEGMEAAVLRSWGESPVRPWVVVIESTYPNSPNGTEGEWEHLIRAKGYDDVWFDGLNRYYVSHGHPELTAAFNAPPNVFDNFEVSSSHFSAQGVIRELQQGFEQELSEAVTRIQLAESALTTAAEQATLREQDWQALELRCDELSRDLDGALESAKKQATTLEAERLRLESQCFDLNGQLEAERANCQRMEEDAGSATVRADALDQLVAERTAEIAKLESRIAGFDVEIGKSAAQVEQAPRELDARRNDIAVLTAQVLAAEHLAGRADKAEALLSDATKQFLDRSEKAGAEHAAAIGVLRDQLVQAETRAGQVTEQLTHRAEKAETALVAATSRFFARLDQSSAEHAAAVGALYKQLVHAEARATEAAARLDFERSAHERLRRDHQDLEKTRVREKAAAESGKRDLAAIIIQRDRAMEALARLQLRQVEQVARHRTEVAAANVRVEAICARFDRTVTALGDEKARLLREVGEAHTDSAVERARLHVQIVGLRENHDALVAQGRAFAEDHERAKEQWATTDAASAALVREALDGLRASVDQLRGELALPPAESANSVSATHAQQTSAELHGLRDGVRAATAQIVAIAARHHDEIAAYHAAVAAHHEELRATEQLVADLRAEQQSPLVALARRMSRPFLRISAPAAAIDPDSADGLPPASPANQTHPIDPSSLVDTPMNAPMTTLRSFFQKAETLADLCRLEDADFVYGSYLSVLGRQPDSIGERHYLDKLRSGAAKLEILSALRCSPEGRSYNADIAGLDPAVRRYRNANRPFIGWLVRLLTGREGNSSTERHLRLVSNRLARIENQLARPLVPPAYEALIEKVQRLAERPVAPSAEPVGKDSTVPVPVQQPAVAESWSRRQSLVTNIYRTVLGREASGADVMMWIGQLEAGHLDSIGFVDLLVNCEEARSRSEFFSHLSDGEFVKILYKYVLNYGAYPIDIAVHADRLEQGLGRDKLLLEFLNIRIIRETDIAAGKHVQNAATSLVLGTREFVTAKDWMCKGRDLRKRYPPLIPRRYSSIALERSSEIVVSIITSLYRGGDFIEQFMANMVEQTIWRNCELIIIDADSPEDEARTILKYQADHPNIVYHRCESRIGIYEAWNEGVKRARGRYLTNANLDDLRRFDSFERQAEILNKFPFVDVAYQEFYYSFEGHAPFAKTAAINACSKLPVVTPYNMFSWNSPHNAPMWRSSLHDELGLFDATFRSAGDMEFWMRCLNAGKSFYKVNDPHVAYFINPQGLSTKVDSAGVVEGQRISREYGDRFLVDDLTCSRDRFDERIAAVTGLSANGAEPNHVIDWRYDAAQAGLRALSRAFRASEGN